MVMSALVSKRAKTLEEMDPFYRKYATMQKPSELTCNCGWLGDKPKTVRFKKATTQNLCPDCGQFVYQNAEFNFWITAQEMKPGLMLTEEGIRRIKEELDGVRMKHLPHWEKQVKTIRRYGMTKKDDFMAEAIRKRDFYQERIVILEDIIANAILIK